MLSKYLKLAPNDAILALLSQFQNTTFNILDFQFGDPVSLPVQVPPSGNTSIVITPNPGSSFYGTYTMHYDRLNIADIIGYQTIEILALTELTLSAVIAEVNTKYG